MPKMTMPEYIGSTCNNFVKVEWQHREDQGLATGRWSDVAPQKQVQLRDTVGAPDGGPLRDLAYLGSNVVMLAFDMSDRESLAHITGDDRSGTGWAWEAKHALGRDFADFILVGCKRDVWANGEGSDPNKPRVWPVTQSECWSVAKAIGAKTFVQCSAKTVYGIEELKDCLLEVGMNNRQQIESPMLRPNVGAQCQGRGSHRMAAGQQITTQSMMHSASGAVFAPYGDHLKAVDDHHTIWASNLGGPWWKNPPGEPSHHCLASKPIGWPNERMWDQRRLFHERRSVHH